MSTPAPSILMVIANFHPRVGGAERQALLLARSLQHCGTPVRVLTLHDPALPLDASIDGVPVSRAIRATPGTRWFSVSYFLSTLAYLLRHHRSHTITHCHIAQGLHVPAALVLRMLTGIPVIIKIASSGRHSDFATLRQLRLCRLPLGKILLRLLRHADCIVATSTQAHRDACTAGIPAERISIIANGVDTTHFRPAAATAGTRQLIYAGRLETVKGVDLLLDAFALVCRRFPDARLRILGDGSQRRQLEAQSCALGLADRVTFAGMVDDIAPALQLSSACVLPSRAEGMPNVLLEAMACGVPVVATAVGGCPDIISDGRNGLLVAPEDPGALADAIGAVFSDPTAARAMGDRARHAIGQDYSITAITATYQALYQQLLNHRRTESVQR